MNGFDTSSQFERSGGMRAGGSFSRRRGGAGANRANGGNSYGTLPPSYSQQNELSTSQGPLQQGFQTSQGLPPSQGFQTSQTGYSQGYNSGQQGDVRSHPGDGGGFDRSRGGMGSSFSRGQGSRVGGFASSRPVPSDMGGGFQDRAVPIHSMGGQIQGSGLNGKPGEYFFSPISTIKV